MKCLNCGTTFPVNWKYKNKKYCGRRCYSKALSVLRLGSGNPMFGRKKTKEQIEKTVSKIRGIKRPGTGPSARKGKESNFWKGGVSDERDRIKKSVLYKKWRKAVFERDNYTCQKCGQIGGKLDPHYIKPFAIILDENNIQTLNESVKCEELWDLSNGQTLCKKCHKKTDTYGKSIIQNKKTYQAV